MQWSERVLPWRPVSLSISPKSITDLHCSCNCPTHLPFNIPTHLSYKCPTPMSLLLLFSHSICVQKVSTYRNINVPAGVGAPPLDTQPLTSWNHAYIICTCVVERAHISLWLCPPVVGWFVPRTQAPPHGYVAGYLLRLYTASVFKRKQYSTSCLNPRSLPNGLGTRLAHSTWNYKHTFASSHGYYGVWDHCNAEPRGTAIHTLRPTISFSQEGHTPGQRG